MGKSQGISRSAPDSAGGVSFALCSNMHDMLNRPV
jgi:hypothetical protein